MVIAGGLFAGGAVTFAWSRVPIWRTMPASAFVDDFSQTLHRTDKGQPALLVVAIATSVGFAVTVEGPGPVLALVGAGGFLVVLIASLAVLVALQRRTIDRPQAEAIDEMRGRWFRGNLGRSSLSVVAFVARALASSTV
jgi:hypothetical protein